MIRVGLTGSIGMGKSATAAMFAEAGVPVFDSDAVVHRLYAKGGGAVEPVRALFPEAVREDAVDRVRLGAEVLGRPEALARLNAVVHPLVREARAEFYEAARKAGADVVLLDIPLLFETKAEADLDAVVVVSAPAELQRSRVLARENMTPAKLEAVLKAQMPDADKRARAHHVIDTSQGFDDARAQVRDILRRLRGLGETGH